jgi:hypothetical protein
MITITTRICPECGLSGNIEVTEESLKKYKSGAHVQDAFPFLSADIREMLITGLHPNCWYKSLSHPFNEWKEEDGGDGNCNECGESLESLYHK